MNAEARWLLDHHLKIVRRRSTGEPYVAIYAGKWRLTLVVPVETKYLGFIRACHAMYVDRAHFDEVAIVSEEDAEREYIEGILFDKNWVSVLALRDRLRELYPPSLIEVQLQSKKRSHQ
jgi:hypothetical protein